MFFAQRTFGLRYLPQMSKVIKRIWAIKIARKAILASLGLARVVGALMIGKAVFKRPLGQHACESNLYQVFFAIETYRSKTGSYPPAYVTDKYGRRVHSWRILIVTENYARGTVGYKFSQPWDSEDNLNALEHPFRERRRIPERRASWPLLVSTRYGREAKGADSATVTRGGRTFLRICGKRSS